MIPKPLVLAASIAALLTPLAPAQDVFTWTGGGADDFWSNPANWSGTAPNGSDILNFGSGSDDVANNDFPGGYSGYRIFFTAGTAGAFTLGGNPVTLADFGGSAPKLENNSIGLQTVNFALTLNGAGTGGTGEINAVDGDITFGPTASVTLAESTDLHLFGQGRTVILGGGVLAGSGTNRLVLKGANTVILEGVSTYTGNTEIEAGILAIGGTINDSSQISVGNGATTASPATLVLSNALGGQFLNNQIVINAGDGTNRIVGGTNTGGTNTFLGNLVMDGPGGNRSVNLTAAAEGTVDFAGVISGAGHGVNKVGDGTALLSGVNTYTGGTTVSAGVLRINGIDVLVDTGVVNIAGGTLDIGGFGETVGAVTLTSGSITGSFGLLTAPSFAVQSGLISAPLDSTGALTKTTPGVVELSGSSIYTGGTIINEGLLKVANASGMGAATGAVAVNTGGTLLLAADNIGNPVTLNGGTIASTTGFGGGSSYIGDVNFAVSTVINLFDPLNPAVDTHVNLSSNFAGIVSGTGVITVNANPTNATSGGKLRFKNVTTSGTFNGTLLINSDAIGQIQGAGLVNGLGSGAAIHLNNTGPYFVSGGNSIGGRLELITSVDTDFANAIVALGTGTSNSIVVGSQNGADTNRALSVGSLTIGESTLFVNRLATSGAGYTLSVTGPTTLTGSPVFNITTTPFILNGISDGGAAFGFTKEGAGELRLLGAGAFTGPVNLNTGTVALGSATALGTGPLNWFGGLLTSVANLTGVDRVNNAITLGAANAIASGGAGSLELTSNLDFLEVGRTITAAPVNGLILSGILSNDGGLGLTKSSNNPVTLAGAASNTYTGPTLVTGGNVFSLAKTGGAIAIPGNLTLSGTANVSLAGNEQIANNATVTMGTGTSFNVGGNVEAIAAISGTGGTVNIGAAGALSVSQGISVTAGTTNIANDDVAPGRLILGGDFAYTNTTGTYNVNATGPGTQAGYIDLAGGTRAIAVTGGTVNLNAPVKNGTLVKTGVNGVLQLNSIVEPAITTALTVEAGSVRTLAPGQFAPGAVATVGGGAAVANLFLFPNGGAGVGGALPTLNILANGTVQTSGVASSAVTFTAAGPLTVSGGSLVLNSGVMIVAPSVAIGGPGTGTNPALLLGGNNTTRRTEFVVGPGGLVMDGAAATLNLGSATGAQGSRLTLTGDVRTVASDIESRIIPGTSGPGTRNLDLRGALRTFNVADGSAANDLTISVVINSTDGAEPAVALPGGGLIKTGAGTLNLTAANAYDAGTSVREGTVAFNGADRFGAGPISLGQATGSLDVSLVGSASLTLANPITLVPGGGGSIVLGSSGAAAVVYGSALELTRDLTLSAFGSTGSTRLSGVISGTGNILANSVATGVATLGAVNTFTGDVNLASGILQVITKDSLGPVATNELNAAGGTTFRAGATLTGANAILNNINLAGPMTLSGATSSFTLGGVIAGATGSLSKSGTSTVSLIGTANTFGGGVSVSAGTLAVQTDASLGEASGDIELSGGILQTLAVTTLNAERTVNLTGTSTISNALALSIDGRVTGPGSLVKVGTGALTLANLTNDFTGPISLNAGPIVISDEDQLGEGGGAINFNGGFLRATGNINSNRGVTFTNASVIAFNNDVGTTVEFSGAVSGNGLLRVDNSLSSATSLPNTTVILSGTGSNGTGATNISGNSVFSLRGPALGTGNLSVVGNSVLELTSSTGDMRRSVTAGTVAGGITLTTSNGAGFAAFGGDRVVNLGSGEGASTALVWGTSNFLVTGGNVAPNLLFGSSTADSTVDFQNNLDLNAGTAAATRNFLLVNGPSALEGRFSGVITRSGSGGATLSIIGTGAIELTNGNNGSTGNPFGTIVRGGTLLLGANATSGAGNTVLSGETGAIQIGDTVAVSANGFNGPAALLTNGPFNVSRNITVNGPANTATATFGGNADATSVFSGNVVLNKAARLTSASTGVNRVIVSGAISGAAGSLAKIGSGIAELAAEGGNTYAGGTSVSAGTLLVSNATGSATGSGSVVVEAAARLGGSGSVSGAVTVRGTLAPGQSTGQMGTGALSLEPESVFSLELGGTSAGFGTNGLDGYDRVNVTGGVSLAGALQGSLLNNFQPQIGQDVFYFIINDDVDPVQGTFAGVAQGGLVEFGGSYFTVSYTADSTVGGLGGFDAGGNDVALLVAVPEPGAAVMLLGGFGMLLGLRRFRRC